MQQLNLIYKSEQMPNAAHFISLWQKLARENGLAGLTFVTYKACRPEEEIEVLKRLLSYGFDYVNFIRLDCHIWPIWQKLYFRTPYKLLRRLSWRILPEIHFYRYAIKYFNNDNDKLPSVIPTLVPNWDNTPRCRNLGKVMVGSSPKLFKESVEMAAKNAKLVSVDIDNADTGSIVGSDAGGKVLLNNESGKLRIVWKLCI